MVSTLAESLVYCIRLSNPDIKMCAGSRVNSHAEVGKGVSTLKICGHVE